MARRPEPGPVLLAVHTGGDRLRADIPSGCQADHLASSADNPREDIVQNERTHGGVRPYGHAV